MIRCRKMPIRGKNSTIHKKSHAVRTEKSRNRSKIASWRA